MAQNNAVSITIGAALKSSFGTALGGGRKQLMQMGQALKSLDASGKRIQSFQKLKTDVIAAKNSWQAAETQVRELALAMKQTANPTAKMKSEFEKAKNTAGRAKAAYEKKQESLRQVRLEMKAAGQSTRNLAAQQTKLGASVDRLKSKYHALDQALKRGDGIKARRAALRGQILDMVALGAAMGAPLKAAIDFESEMSAKSLISRTSKTAYGPLAISSKPCRARSLFLQRVWLRLQQQVDSLVCQKMPCRILLRPHPRWPLPLTSCPIRQVNPWPSSPISSAFQSPR